MPYKDPEKRKEYEKARYQRKKAEKAKREGKLDHLLLKKQLNRISPEEEQELNTLVSVLPKPEDEEGFYKDIPENERIIKGDSDQEYSHSLGRTLPPQSRYSRIFDSSENKPKTRLSQQSKEWWINPQTGEWEEKPTPKRKDKKSVWKWIWI